MSQLVIRNITINSERSSMRLEREVWNALREICLREDVTLSALLTSVGGNAAPGTRTSAVRVYVIEYFRAASTQEGHEQAGHGRQLRIAAGRDGQGPVNHRREYSYI